MSGSKDTLKILVEDLKNKIAFKEHKTDAAKNF